MSKISWIGLLRTAIPFKKALEKMTGTPGALESKQNWYNLIKAIAALLTVCGIGFVSTVTDADMKSVSAIAAITIPAVLTLLDGVAQIWLKVRKPDSKKMLAERTKQG